MDKFDDHDQDDAPTMRTPARPAPIRLGVKATDFQGPLRTKDMARAKRTVDRKMKRGKR